MHSQQRTAKVMGIEAGFDIQQIKNSSTKQKNALQLEWQDTIRDQSSPDNTAILADLSIDEAKFPTMLPTVFLALNYKNRLNAQPAAVNHTANSVADWSH